MTQVENFVGGSSRCGLPKRLKNEQKIYESVSCLFFFMFCIMRDENE